MIAPRLEAAVSGERGLAVASLEVGSVRRAATMAMTRQRLPSGPRRRSSPIWRSVPRTAATWPCGSARRMVNTSGGEPFRVLHPADDRQIELEQGVKQPALGDLEPSPSLDVLRLRQVGDDAVMTAGDTVTVGTVGRNQPVAYVKLGVGAEAERPTRVRQSRPGAAGPLDCAKVLKRRREAQFVPTALAVGVFEIERLLAKLAFEEFHASSARLR